MNNHKLNTLILLTLAFFATSCGGGSNENGEGETVAEATPAAPMTLEEAEKGWKTNKGVGPIKSVNLAAEIDQTLADAGMVIFEAKCSACHKVEKKFIGPSPKGIMEKRTPEWVMNMILNPEGMVAEDPIARQLLMKFSAPMANQSLTEDEARSVVEYFRTL
ncbi:MAG: cytochrome c [Cyclobacteriaceae bacterium]|nr:cytochrome c [Cyclobacteriaceae bacterium]